MKFPNRTNHAARVGTQACIHKCLQMRCPLALMFLLPLRLAGRTSYKWDMLVCMLVYRFFVALMCSGTIFCPFPLPGSNPEAPGRRVLKYGRPDRMVFTVGGYIRVYVCVCVSSLLFHLRPSGHVGGEVRFGRKGCCAVHSFALHDASWSTGTSVERRITIAPPLPSELY